MLLDGGDVPAPTTTNLGRKKRKRRQRCKERYAKVREDAQLSGIIPTVPEGAVRNEIAPVAPDPPLPHLVRAAIKNNWATPDSAKPAIIDALLEPFYDPDADCALLVKCFRVLFLLDQTQYERDHPEVAGKGRRSR
ncbi:MAG: hypothetical protein ACRELF_07000 [Gemmataceae bacterium]